MPKKKRVSNGQFKKYHYKRKYNDSTLTATFVTVHSDHSYAMYTAETACFDEVQEDSFWRLPWLDDLDDGTDGHTNTWSSEVTDSDLMTGHEFYVILDKPYRYHHTVNLEDFVENLCTGVIYSRLKTELESCNHPAFVNMPNSNYIRYIQCYDSDDPKVKMSVTVMPNLTADIHVHGIKLSRNHDIWKDMPVLFWSKKNIWKLLNTCSLPKYKVCAGNFEPEYQNLVPIGRHLEIKGSEYSSFREGDYSAYHGTIRYHSTIRSTKCRLLVDGLRCRDCSVYRRSLKTALERERSKPPTSSVNWLKSKKGESRMSETEKLQKLNQYKKYTHELEIKCRKLERKISQLIKTEGVKLSLIPSSKMDSST